LDRRHVIGFAVCRTVRVLDILPAPRAATEDDHAPERASHDRCAGNGRTCRSGSAAKAAQPGHGYYSAEKPRYRRYAASCTGTPARRGPGNFGRWPGALDVYLQATINDVFS